MFFALQTFRKVPQTLSCFAFYHLSFNVTCFFFRTPIESCSAGFYLISYRGCHCNIGQYFFQWLLLEGGLKPEFFQAPHPEWTISTPYHRSMPFGRERKWFIVNYQVTVCPCGISVWHQHHSTLTIDF